VVALLNQFGAETLSSPARKHQRHRFIPGFKTSVYRVIIRFPSVLLGEVAGMHDLRCSLRLIAISRIAQETPTTIRVYRAGREDVQHSSCCRICRVAPLGSAVRTSSATARPHVAQALLEDFPLRSIIRQAAREASHPGFAKQARAGMM
jgi:hypothetical protein